MKAHMDPFEGLSKEEIEEKEKRVQEMNYSNRDVFFLFWTALKVLFPIVLFFVIGYGLFYLLFMLW